MDPYGRARARARKIIYNPSTVLELAATTAVLKTPGLGRAFFFDETEFGLAVTEFGHIHCWP